MIPKTIIGTVKSCTPLQGGAWLLVITRPRGAPIGLGSQREYRHGENVKLRQIGERWEFAA